MSFGRKEQNICKIQQDKMKLILDTSVVFKWFVSEAGSDKALEYLQDFLQGKIKILFPTLLFYELGNACLYSKIPVNEISHIMELLQRNSFEVEDIGYTAFRKIYQNAFEYTLSYYDASYLTLSQKYDCELVTADKKLFNNLKKNFKRITLLN